MWTVEVAAVPVPVTCCRTCYRNSRAPAAGPGSRIKPCPRSINWPSPTSRRFRCVNRPRSPSTDSGPTSLPVTTRWPRSEGVPTSRSTSSLGRRTASQTCQRFESTGRNSTRKYFVLPCGVSYLFLAGRDSFLSPWSIPDVSCGHLPDNKGYFQSIGSLFPKSTFSHIFTHNVICCQLVLL